MFPDAGSGYAYDDDGLFRLPNVTRVPQRISTRKFANACTFDGAWYDRLFKRIGFDVVWCNLVEIAAQIKMAGSLHFYPAQRAAIVAAHNYTMHRSLPNWEIGGELTYEHVLWLQLMGSICADANVFNSDHMRDMLIEEARDRLSPAMLARIESTAHRIDLGTIENEWKEVDHQTDLPVIAYNHRLQGYKRWRVTFDVLNDLWQEGLRFRVRYTSSTIDNVGAIRSLPFVEVRLCATRAEYLDALSGCHLNVTNSVHETFCISAVESMAQGQPLVAPDSVTFPQITGAASGNGYPYLFASRDEQKAHLRRLITDPTERARAGALVRKHTLASYTQRLWVERYCDLFGQLVEAHAINVDERLVAEAGAILRKQGAKGATVREFYNKLQRVRINGKGPVGDQSFPLAKVIRLARLAGGKVCMRAGEQRISVL